MPADTVQVEGAGSGAPVQRRAIWYRHLAWILIGVAVVRGLLVVASDPLLAVANNYDQIRVQACLDAYPDRDAEIPPGTNNPSAPFERFRYIPNVGAPCFLTSELLFAWAAWPGMQLESRLRADRTFSIRWKGGLQLLFWLAVAIWCTRRLVGLNRPDLALGHALVCAVVITDPGNVLYFNTFYSEASAILFCYLLFVGILVALARPQPPGRGILLMIALAAFLLATSKIQHLIVPAFIWLVVACSGMIARKLPKALLVALAIGVVAGAGAQLLHMGAAENDGIRSANLVDTLFLAMLPNASDPEAVIAQLGLPEQCIEQSGKSWYTPGMRDRQRCPQVFGLHHRDLLLPILRDPAMAIRALQGGTAYASPWIPSHLGLVEGEVNRGLPVWAPSLNAVSDFSGGLHVELLAGLPLLALGVIVVRRRSSQLAANTIVLAMSVLPLLIFVISVFGDGYVDLSKHIQLGTACFFVAISTLACLLVDFVFLSGRNHVID